MRASTLPDAVLELPGVRVGEAVLVDGELRVTVRLRRRQLDMGGRVCRIVLRRGRLRCPEHGLLVESVPFATSRTWWRGW